MTKQGINAQLRRKFKAPTDSTHSLPMAELIHPMVFPNRAIAKTTIVEWIEVFYNRKRLHSTLGFLPPAQFEEKYSLALQPPVPASFHYPLFLDKVRLNAIVVTCFTATH